MRGNLVVGWGVGCGKGGANWGNSGRGEEGSDCQRERKQRNVRAEGERAGR